MEYLIGFIGGIIFYILITPIVEMILQFFNIKLQVYQSMAQQTINEMFPDQQENSPAIGFDVSEPCQYIDEEE